jgi:HAD superfamily hydrolase (TIGR01509 family)
MAALPLRPNWRAKPSLLRRAKSPLENTVALTTDRNLRSWRPRLLLFLLRQLRTNYDLLATSFGDTEYMLLPIPAGDFRAYLFDCDGTIADSMPLHYKAWKRALADYRCPYPQDLFYAWGGKPVRKIIADLNQMHGLQMPIDEVASRKESYYHELLPELRAVPSVLEHVNAQFGRIPLAVVSGSRRASVVGSLRAIGLLEKFEPIISAEDYEHGKPAPDCFLLAAERLHIRPVDCLVFEDTDLGIEAAGAAGMASVRVLETMPARMPSETIVTSGT